MNLYSRTIKSFTRREKIVTAILLAILVFSFYKLAFSPDGGKTISQGKVYTEAVVGEIKRINPVFTEFSEADRDISSLVFSGLVKYNSATGEFEEGIATHTLSEDKLTYTFTLKNDVLWHDGTEVSAADIFFTFADVIQSPDFSNPILKSNFDGLKVEQVDTRTVSFTLSSPNSFFFSGMTVGILPQHILADVPVSSLDTHEFNQMPIGTGPYQVGQSYEFLNDGSTSVTLQRFDDFYGEEFMLEQVRFVAFPTIADLIENRSQWHGAAQIKQSVLDEIEIDDFSIHRYELPQYTALFFNTDSDQLLRNKARLGISKAIDKELILEAIGYNTRIDTPLLELDQGEWLHETNLEEAQGAFFDVGWTLEEDAEFRTDEDGEEINLRLVRRDFTGVNEPQEESAQLTSKSIRDQLAEVGIKVTIEAYPIDELQNVIRTRNYDMLLYGQSLGYNLDTFSYWHSSQANEDGLNLSNYQNARADFNIESIRETFDPEERQALLQDLGEIIVADVPALFLYTPSYYYIVDPKVTGVQFEKLLLPVDRLANIYQWEFN